MDNLHIEDVREAQALMLAAGQPYLVGSESDDLRGLIRITIEFFHFLEGRLKLEGILEGDEVNYAIDTIFSGVDSFMLLSAAYKSASKWGPKRSQLGRNQSNNYTASVFGALSTVPIRAQL
jgi:hypothetical protein